METKNNSFEFHDDLIAGKGDCGELNWPDVKKFTVLRQVYSIDVVCVKLYM